MEVIRGRKPLDMDSNAFTQRLAGRRHILLDLGTGDGRYVRTLAGAQEYGFFIGLDTCRENLRLASRKAPPNALFIIASAQMLPAELKALVSCITINFPWGSLLRGLLENDSLAAGLRAITAPRAGLEILVNAEALATAGHALETGANRIESNLNAADWSTCSLTGLDSRQLRSVPTTWARRLAFGRDPRAVRLSLRGSGTR